MIKASAPGGFGLIGDPADMFGGSVIACSLRERAHCILDDSPLQKRISVEVGDQRATIESVQDLKLQGDSLDCPKAVLSALEVLSTSARPFSLSLHWNCALDHDLFGRTAMLTAVAGCVLHHLGVFLNVYETAELVRRIETDLLGSPCGFHAQYSAAFGGICYMDFRGKDCGAPQEQDSPFATIEPMSAYIGQLPLLLAYVPDPPGSPARSERLASEACTKLTRLACLAKKALLAEQWEILGDLINQSDALQREIIGSDPPRDVLIAAARESGAVGARRLDGGRSIIALSPELERTADALKSSGAQTIHFPTLSRGLTVEITA